MALPLTSKHFGLIGSLLGMIYGSQSRSLNRIIPSSLIMADLGEKQVATKNS